MRVPSTGVSETVGLGIAADSPGNAYVAGLTNQIDTPRKIVSYMGSQARVPFCHRSKQGAVQRPQFHPGTPCAGCSRIVRRLLPVPDPCRTRYGTIHPRK